MHGLVYSTSISSSYPNLHNLKINPLCLILVSFWVDKVLYPLVHLSRLGDMGSFENVHLADIVVRIYQE